MGINDGPGTWNKTNLNQWNPSISIQTRRSKGNTQVDKWNPFQSQPSQWLDSFEPIRVGTFPFPPISPLPRACGSPRRPMGKLDMKADRNSVRPPKITMGNFPPCGKYSSWWFSNQWEPSHVNSKASFPKLGMRAFGGPADAGDQLTLCFHQTPVPRSSPPRNPQP